MDVKQVKGALGLILFLVSVSACSRKTPTRGTEKFSKPALEDECKEQAIQKQYIIQYKDGTHKLVVANSDDELIEDHIVPNYDSIEVVDRNIKFKVPETPNKVSTFLLPDDDWGQELIEAKEAWENGVKGQGVTVAVIDAGISIDHPLLRNRIYKNSEESFNGKDDDGNGYIDDVFGYNFASNTPNNHDNSGHGTHVAGIIAGEHGVGANNVPTQLGVAPEAKILPLDFIDERAGGTLLSAANSIDYIIKMHEKMNIKVVNASWGGRYCSQILRDKIIELANREILFVSAAGNVHADVDLLPEFPAAYSLDNIISVGAINAKLIMTSWTNYGDNSVDIFAPGEDIYSTVYSSSYAYNDGTSMAAPFVAGAAALLYSIKPKASALEIKQILMREGVFNPNYRGVSKSHLNIANAINAI